MIIKLNRHLSLNSLIGNAKLHVQATKFLAPSSKSPSVTLNFYVEFKWCAKGEEWQHLCFGSLLTLILAGMVISAFWGKNSQGFFGAILSNAWVFMTVPYITGLRAWAARRCIKSCAAATGNQGRQDSLVETLNIGIFGFRSKYAAESHLVRFHFPCLRAGEKNPVSWTPPAALLTVLYCLCSLLESTHVARQDAGRSAEGL